MADRIIVISWGQPLEAREQHGLEVFQEALGYYGELQQAGRIEAFDVVLLPGAALMNGCMLLRGSHAQLDAISEEERFRRLMIDASLVVSDLRVSEGYTGEGVAAEMALYADAIGRVPQMA
jgi:hypothetical protein